MAVPWRGGPHCPVRAHPELPVTETEEGSPPCRRVPASLSRWHCRDSLVQTGQGPPVAGSELPRFPPPGPPKTACRNLRAKSEAEAGFCYGPWAAFRGMGRYQTWCNFVAETSGRVLDWERCDVLEYAAAPPPIPRL